MTVAEVKPTDYRIVVTGELDPRYAVRFEPMQLTTRTGKTEIVGLVKDDADLQGLLETIAALGLSLVSVAPMQQGARWSRLRHDSRSNDAAKTVS